MQYDPIKRSLGTVFNRTPWLRILFYRLLDLLLLRTWHVKRALKQWIRDTGYGIRDTGYGIRILDAGAGFGQYTFYLSRKFPGASIDAVDIKEEQIADCNRFFSSHRRNNACFAVADLTTLVKPDTYHLILSVDVMEHIPEDEQVFRNFYLSLKPGGMVLISTPSDQGGSDVHDHQTESSFIDEHVRHGYNTGEIGEKLKRAGFLKTETHYTYGKPGQTGWKLSMKYPVKLLNVSKIFFLALPFYFLLILPVFLVCNWLDVTMKHSTGTGLLVKAMK